MLTFIATTFGAKVLLKTTALALQVFVTNRHPVVVFISKLSDVV